MGSRTALLLPSGVFLLAFTYWPVLQVALGSLTVRTFGGAAHWGFGNYARLFADPHFATAVRNNLVYAAGTIIPSLTLALLFALGLRESTRLTALLRTLIVLPLLIPLVAAASLFIFIFLPGAGLLDYYLARFGAAETNWLGDPSLALGSIIAITVWKNTGYYMLFFLAGLAGIPQELLDAAKIDGANAVQRFLRVTLPLLGPTLAFVLVIARAERADPGGPRHRHDAGRAIGRNLAAALLHLPAGASELRHRPGIGGDRGQRRLPVRALHRVAAHARARDPL